MIGQLLDGRYQVVRALGSGGFGQTYIAQDTRRPGNPICVVKHLKPATTDPNFLQTARRLFQGEAETLEKLGHHDQIPRLLAFFEQDQEFFLVQEFIEGQALTAELPEGQRWTEAQVVQMLKEVLGVLVFVHSQGVIHRDIKPDNLIRRRYDQRLVLVDFGAVKQVRNLAAAGLGPISATVAIGTPGYMPTEQGQGRPRPNSDIYALGMIGIQALTGLYPHQLQEDLNTGEMIWQHLAVASPKLVGVLEKMTRYHFKDRYQTATETLQALEPLEVGSYPPPIATSPEPAPPAVSSGNAIASQPGLQSPPPPPSVPGYVPPTIIQSAPSQPSPSPQPFPSSQPPPSVPTVNSAPPAAFTPVADPASSRRKMPVIIPLMIGCGAFTVVGFFGLIILSIALPSFLNQANNARESEARNYIGSMNRGQQAYMIENASFSDTIDTLQLGLPTETESYSYQIYAYNEPAVMQVAIAKQPELHSYTGIVWVDNAGLTTAIVCQSDAPSTEPPADPPLLQGTNGIELDCPPGYSAQF